MLVRRKCAGVLIATSVLSAPLIFPPSLYTDICFLSMLTDKPCTSSEEVKTLFQQTQKQIQENQNELKAEIEQLKNMTTGKLNCTFVQRHNTQVCIVSLGGADVMQAAHLACAVS